MIDNYLRTSLIFYDLAEKQDFRKKVLENIHIPKAQMIERYRLPPFNITSTVPIGVPTIFGLYCKHTDIETANLLNVIYSGADLLSLEFDGTNYWLIYDGETYLSASMPTGEQYIRISDGFKTWESEIINIANCPGNTMDWHGKNAIEMIYNTRKRGSGDVVKPNGSFGPMIYYYNNKSYCAWEQKGGTGYSCESMVYAIYHKECFISESYGVGPGTVDASDPHAVPVIIVADDGHIVVAHERLTGAPGSYPPNRHNGYMQIKRSDNPEDETLWVNAIAHNPNYFDEKGNEVNNRLSYSSLDKLPNGKLFLFCRHSSIASLNRISIHRSADHGVSWNDLGGNIDGGCDVVDLRPVVIGSDLIYKGLCKHPYNNSLHLMVWWYDDGANYPDLYYLESHDNGVNWQDISGGFIQDITIAGNNPITKANLDNPANDFLVKNSVNPERIVPRDGVITDAGIPYIAAIKGPIGTYKPFIYYWDGVAWIETDMGFAVSVEPISVIFQREDVMEIIFADEQDTTFERNIYRSRNLISMNDWTLIKTIYERAIINHEMWGAAATFNYTVADYEAFAAALRNRIDFYTDFYIQAEVDICGCCSGLSKAIIIEYENKHDFAGILSQVGYKGRVHLCADIRKPDQKIIKTGIERDGENWIQKIITQKIYRFNILCTESLIDTLTIIPSYETITIHLDNESAEVKEFNVAPPEWKYEGLGQLEISFIVETIIKTNCDADYSLQEELILNGDFSVWAGDNPVDWTVVGEVGADPEISEVAPNEGHGGAGTEACNIFTTGANISIRQNIMTIGKVYLIKIEVTRIIAGSIQFIMGQAGTVTIITTEGIYTFIRICDGIDEEFRIHRLGACDITIDNVSVKLYS